MSYLTDGRTKRQILLDIERKLDTLLKEEEQVIMADIFDRIIAGIAAIQAGDNQALEQHVAAIDTHLSSVDGEVLGLQNDDASSKGRLDAIETGLGKIADTFTPAPTTGGTATPPSGGTATPPSSGDGTTTGGTATPPSGGTATPPSSGDGTTSTPPSDGSQSADVGPGGPAPAAIPAAGPGSETTGQVDTPVTTG